MVEKNLEKVFLEAAEVAKKLPKNLQEAGFNRALDQLLRKSSATVAGGRESGGAGRQRRKMAEQAERGDIKDLLNAIDRTAQSDVGATARVGDRALKVLQLADRDHGVDGLTAGEIATILARKFRLPTKANSVMKALERETDTVDIRGGSGVSRVFHIMAPGEAYLEKLRSGEQKGRRSKSKRRGSGSKAPTRESSSNKEAPAKRTTAKKKAGRKTVGRPGPKAALGQLMQSGFFHSARTISDIQEELQHRRGHGYTVQELSPALVRSIRDESLTRERNSSGQYEYREA